MGWQVSVEPTPNPATLKFAFNSEISPRTADFKMAGEADDSPLASKIFGFPWAKEVYIGANFVSVTKAEWVDWEILAEPLAGLIREHIENGEPVMLEDTGFNSEEETETDPLIIEIKKLLDREIRPAVAMDGGDVVFRKFDSGRLYISMKGACSGCPSSQITLKEGIEVRLKEVFPQIQEVLAI